MIIFKFIAIYIACFVGLFMFCSIFMNGAFNGLVFIIAVVPAIIITKALPSDKNEGFEED